MKVNRQLNQQGKFNLLAISEGTDVWERVANLIFSSTEFLSKLLVSMIMTDDAQGNVQIFF